MMLSCKPMNRMRHVTLIFHCKFRRCAPRAIQTTTKFLRISKEVLDALRSNIPIVALETTIYTHGFPYPDNLALASRLEDIVRENGGVPATIGVFRGLARVGFENHELSTFLQEPGAQKISRRDLGFLLGSGMGSHGKTGGTTIAGTMILAHMAGIKVFATGGLGGVHKGGESSLDISADLTELGRTPVAVVSSGCKSFLDIPRSLEYLETEGVAVATFADGRVGSVDFPAFWSRDSGINSPKIVQDEAEAASIIYAQNSLGLSTGLVLANPVPLESSIPFSKMQDYIEEAVTLAVERDVRGSDNTPFILRAIQDISEGRSVAANRALVESNVRRGTKVAVELAKLQTPEAKTSKFNFHRIRDNFINSTNSEIIDQPKATDILVAGALAIDTSFDYSPLEKTGSRGKPKLYTSNPAKTTLSIGGVGHNVAQAINLLGGRVKLCSVVADDDAGRTALNLLSKEGLDTTTIKIASSDEGKATSQYTAFNDAEKNLHIAMADMSILESPGVDLGQYCENHLDYLKPKWLIVDANWNHDLLRRWTDKAKSMGACVAFEPVSQEKSMKLFYPVSDRRLPVFPHHVVDIATPNAVELSSMNSKAREAGFFDRQDWWEVIDSLGIPSSGANSQLIQATSAELVNQGIPQQSIQLLPFVPCILTKLGQKGVLLTKVLSSQELNSEHVAPYIVARARPGANLRGIYMRLYPVPETVLNPVSVNGAGDTFMGTLIAGLTTNITRHVEDMVDIAQRASNMTLRAKEAVHPQLGVLRQMILRRAP